MDNSVVINIPNAFNLLNEQEKRQCVQDIGSAIRRAFLRKTGPNGNDPFVEACQQINDNVDKSLKDWTTKGAIDPNVKALLVLSFEDELEAPHSSGPSCNPDDDICEACQ